MSISHGIAIFAAAFAAGVMNSVAGGGTLITFPILIAFGMDPKIANATSTVALVPGSVGGIWGYRREMHDARPLLIRLTIPSIFGGAAGAALLMVTPVSTFANLVPYLILFATAVFIAQEPISRHLRKRRAAFDPSVDPSTHTPSRGWWIGAAIFQFWVAVYGGYFGAGIGILMLASLGLLGVSDIHRANGTKNFLAMCINGVAVISFIAFRMVNWPEALLMSVGAVLGGYGSADIARRLGQSVIRKVVVAIGLLIGLAMLWKQLAR
jgi:uncharacterized protein